MKLIFLPTVLLYLSSITAQTPCDEWIKKNGELIKEKAELDENYDKLVKTNLQLVRDRDKYYNLYILKSNLSDSLTQVIVSKQDIINNLVAERDKARETAKSFEADSRKYGKAMVSIDSLTSIIDAKQKVVDEAQIQKTEKEKAVKELKLQIEDYRKILNDRISVRNETVYIYDNEFRYDTEILFIPYSTSSTGTIVIDEEMRSNLVRLLQLISKYDFKVKLKLIGESSENISTSRRKELALQRAENLQSFILSHIKLPNDASIGKESFSKIGRESQAARIGVSIQVTRK